ncbi:MAG: hypothetical protein IKQ10_09000 [Oscillospiraceae bacterium]|nr:hypothetical protein [Oscillospiraceae bacterium]
MKAMLSLIFSVLFPACIKTGYDWRFLFFLNQYHSISGLKRKMICFFVQIIFLFRFLRASRMGQ